MRKIVYYVATTIDGFIASPKDEINNFVGEGNGLQQYLTDLASFDTVIMGRRTYEFGYKFGLKPGQAAYPHMKHFIFSNTLHFDQPDEKVKVCKINLEEVKAIREMPGTDIYLCGGGDFACWLLENQQIDILKIKLNPVVLGEGIRLFGSSTKIVQMELMNTQAYEKGLQIITYQLKY